MYTTVRDIYLHTHTDITLEPRLVPRTTRSRLTEGEEAVSDICGGEIVNLHDLTVVRRALGAHCIIFWVWHEYTFHPESSTVFGIPLKGHRQATGNHQCSQFCQVTPTS